MINYPFNISQFTLFYKKNSQISHNFPVISAENKDRVKNKKNKSIDFIFRDSTGNTPDKKRGAFRKYIPYSLTTAIQ